jgi:N-acetylglutamate synthase-like GNAT family acetyltransferase
MVSGKTVHSRGPQLRPARNEDMASIRDLIRLFPGHLVQENIPRAPSFFVAHAGGRLVGCCALQVYSK